MEFIYVLHFAQTMTIKGRGNSWIYLTHIVNWKTIVRSLRWCTWGRKYVCHSPSNRFSLLEFLIFSTDWLSNWKRAEMRVMQKYCLFYNGSHAFANICSIGATRLDIPNLTPHTITIVICMRPLCCTYTLSFIINWQK